MQISTTAFLLVSSCFAAGEAPDADKPKDLSVVAPLVGSWQGRGELPTGQTFIVPELEYQWMLDDRAITFQSTTNLPDGTTLQKRSGIILWDPSDKKVKMWVADSAGGNIQATLREAKDGELAWDADAVLPDGQQITFQFSISIQGEKKHTVKRGEATFEMQKKEK